MADEMKKYLDHGGLTAYNEKIKKVITDGDEQALQDAKDYADGLADNYDAAGSATTAESNAKAYAKDYTDALANGAVKENTEAIATNAGDITTMKGQIAALEAGTYDDTEVRELISDNTEAITATDNKVNTLIGDDTGKSVRAITLEEVAKILNDNDSSDIDTLEEIAAWIADHPDSVAELNAKISANETAINNLKTLVGVLPEGETSTTVVAYIEKLEAALDARVDVIEDNIGTGKVDDRIATAKQEAINTAATDATTKAGTAETNAKSYTDEKIAEFTPISTAEINALFA